MNPKFVYRMADAVGFLTSRFIMPFMQWINVTILVEKKMACWKLQPTARLSLCTTVSFL